MQPSHLAIRPADSREVTVIKDFAELHKVLEQDDSGRFLIAPEAMKAYLDGDHFAGVEAGEDVVLQLQHGEFEDLTLSTIRMIPNGLGNTGLLSVPRKVIERLSGGGRNMQLPHALFDPATKRIPKLKNVPQTRQVQLPPVCSAIPARSSEARDWLRENLLDVSPENLLFKATNADEATAYKAGLLLWYDLLDESHSLSQSIEGVGEDGDYWHAIMHRREPDFGNAKYWFRRVGQHPVFTQLAEQANRLAGEYEDRDVSDRAKRLTNNGWDSFAMVDLAEEVHQPAAQDSPLHEFAERVQALEILLLLQHTMRAAAGIQD